MGFTKKLLSTVLLLVFLLGPIQMTTAEERNITPCLLLSSIIIESEETDELSFYDRRMIELYSAGILEEGAAKDYLEELFEDFAIDPELPMLWKRSCER